MRTENLEFHGSLQREEFLDGLCITEEGVDEGLDEDYNYPVDEDLEEKGNNYFMSEPIFDTSDIEEDYDRLDLGLKFDVSDVEDEDEFDKCEQNKYFESCPNFILSDKEVNNEKLKILFIHSNEESIQESIQEYL